ncbi:MAG TPA: hypothetical protein V6D17_01610 [Candidatus Obscuribacterales bacterium]
MISSGQKGTKASTTRRALVFALSFVLLVMMATSIAFAQSDSSPVPASTPVQASAPAKADAVSERGSSTAGSEPNANANSSQNSNPKPNLNANSSPNSNPNPNPHPSSSNAEAPAQERPISEPASSQPLGAAPELIPLPDDGAPGEPDLEARARLLPESLRSTPIGQMIMREMKVKDVRKRPMLYFRRWANKPLPPVATFLFVIFVNTLATALIRPRLDAAGAKVKEQFWKCLGSGILGLALFVISVKACFDAGVLAPLALVLLGVLQLGALTGMAVTSRLLGTSILARATSHRSDWRTNALVILIGSLLFTIVLLLPGIGGLPRIGARLAILMCLLGFGGLLRSRLGTSREAHELS